MKYLKYTLIGFLIGFAVVVTAAPAVNVPLIWNGTNFSATTSPTVGWITATSTIATSTFAGPIGITANGTAGTALENTTDGLLNLINTLSNAVGLQVYTNNGANTDSPLVLFRSDNTAFDDGVLRIMQDGTAGGAYNIRMDGPAPQIEWVESDQATPAGKFETGVNGDSYYIAGRNAGDSSFDIDFTFTRGANGGRLGVGTTSPYAKLSVVGEVVGSYFTATSTAGSSFGGTVTAPGFTSTRSNSWLGFTDNNNYLRNLTKWGSGDNSVIDSTNTEIGIGTASPEGELHAAKAGGPLIVLQNTSNSNRSGTIRFAGSSGIGGSTQFINASNNLEFGTNSAVDMTLTAGGSLGLGTTTPYAKLSVVGETVSSYFSATSSTATSTFSGYLNIGGAAKNCLAYDGRCAVPRWLAPYHGGFTPAVTTATTTASQFIHAEFEVPAKGVMDQICYVVGWNASGNVRLAVYGPVVTEESIVSAPLVAETASTAQSSANASQCILIGPSTLLPGRYYVGLHPETSASTYMRQSNQIQVTGWGGTFNVAYGSLPATATTTTNTGSAIPGLKVRFQTP